MCYQSERGGAAGSPGPSGDLHVPIGGLGEAALWWLRPHAPSHVLLALVAVIVCPRAAAQTQAGVTLGGDAEAGEGAPAPARRSLFWRGEGWRMRGKGGREG